MAVQPMFLRPVPYGTRFSTVSTPTRTVCNGLDVVPCVGAVYNLFLLNSAVLVQSHIFAKGSYRMAVRPMFSPPVPYGTHFSTVSILT